MTLLLGLVCLLILFQYLPRPGGYVAFPAVFAVLYIGWVLPQVASHFVAAEVRHFCHADREAALDWLSPEQDSV